MSRLEGKTIVVTAGYGDIGRATCRRLCEEGGSVIMTGRKNIEEGSGIARETQTGTGTIEYLRCDAASRVSIDEMFEHVLQTHPRIDVVIGNAAMVENGPFLDIRPDQWQAHLDLNLTGSFHLGQAAARIMVKQEPLPRPGCERGIRGKIIFNSSWVQELAVQGIRVNIVAPGLIMAGLSKMCYETDPNFGPRAMAAIPLREFGTPEQCADAFLFLSSDESDYITGISLLVDGGASLPRRD